MANLQKAHVKGAAPSPSAALAIVDARPTKAFFVSMLTRDIDLQDAVLDLLDNSVDGLMRTLGAQGRKGATPYKGYWAKLTFAKGSFSIEDNCGGISKKLAKDSAFRMGRTPLARAEDRHVPTVGTYGIGMKRAIFKLGRTATVVSRTSAEAFRVQIGSDWFDDASDEKWSFTLEDIPSKGTLHGTNIEVTSLLGEISQEFSPSRDFATRFSRTVSQQYSLIIEKGFAVYVNGILVKPLPIQFSSVSLKDYKEGIAPYLFDGVIDEVKISLSVGFYKPVPDEAEIEEQESTGTFTSDEAGWTIICNDRVVLYHDKSILTGWGEAGVPSFHNQFISISGTVHFTADDASKLPLTTTKRGVNVGSEVYLRTKDKMREGTKLFTNYTNRLKKDKGKKKELFAQTGTINVSQLRQGTATTSGLRWTNDRKIEGKTFTPSLPKLTDDRLRTIRFSRTKEEIAELAEYLLEDANAKPADLGNACFDHVLTEAREV